jgi:WD40 repeat protein
MPTFRPAGLTAVCLIGALALAAAPPARPGAPETAAATDAFGDPLPPGAIARLGSTRLRHACIALAWAPDGKTFVSSGQDGTLRVWDAVGGKEIRRFTGQGGVFLNAVAYLPDGKCLVAVGIDGSIRVLDVGSGREAHEARTLWQAERVPVAALAYRPDDGTALTLGLGATLHAWDLTTGKLVRQINSQPKQTTITPQALSPDGRRYAAWTPDDVLTVWDADGKELFHAPTQFQSVDGLVFSADGKTLAVSSGAASQVALWDVDAGKELRRLEEVRVPGHALAFSPDGKRLAGKGADGAVHVWATASGKDLHRFELPPRTPIGWPLAFSPDGKTLAVADGLAIHLWDVEAEKELHEFVGHNGPVEDVRFSADGRRVLTCGRDGTAGRWDAATGKLLTWRTRPQGGEAVASAAADGKTILFGQQGGVVRWEPGDDKPAEHPLVGELPAAVTALALSADGKTLAGYGTDHFIHIWDAEGGKEKGKVKIEQAIPPVFALSVDGGLLAFCNHDAPLRLWDVTAGREVRQFEEESVPGAPPDRFPVHWATRLAFSPDGRTLAAWNPSLSLWELATGRERMRVSLPFRNPRIEFSPDGGVLAVGGEPVLLLDAADGWELARLAGHDGGATALAFAPDGRTLASAGEDDMGLIWDVKEWMGRKRPIAELTPEKLPVTWKGLQDGDASRAYKAVLALAASPKAAAPYLKQLLGAEGPEERRIARLITDLNNDDFDAREKAEKELKDLEETPIPAVRQALGANPPKDAQKRMQEVLDRHKEVTAVAEGVRRLRAEEALERCGAPEAVEALRALAKDGQIAAVKQEAAAALDRLARRRDAP